MGFEVKKRKVNFCVSGNYFLEKSIFLTNRTKLLVASQIFGTFVRQNFVRLQSVLHCLFFQIRNIFYLLRWTRNPKLEPMNRMRQKTSLQVFSDVGHVSKLIRINDFWYSHAHTQTHRKAPAKPIPEYRMETQL